MSDAHDNAVQSERLTELRAEIGEDWDEASWRLAKVALLSGDLVVEEAAALDRRVREEPWPYVLWAFGIGVALGFLLSD